MRRTLIAWSMVLLALPAGAQQRPRSDSLPRELVTALLGGSLGSRQVDVQAGLADDSLPADLFRDALVLGFANYRIASTTVAYFPYDPKMTIDTIKTRLAAAGWKVAPEDPDTIRGFVPAFGGTRPLAICRDRQVVVPTVIVRSLNRTLAVISRQGSQGSDYLCGGRSQLIERIGRRSTDDTPLPSLTVPPGMEMHGAGSSGVASQDRAMSMSTSLTGTMPLKQIVAHYSDLFVKAGWTKVEEQFASSIGVTTFEITSKGVPWHCAFIVSIPTTGAADVQLMLRMK
jgi:hypothetical protein